MILKRERKKEIDKKKDLNWEIISRIEEKSRDRNESIMATVKI